MLALTPTTSTGDRARATQWNFHYLIFGIKVLVKITCQWQIYIDAFWTAQFSSILRISFLYSWLPLLWEILDPLLHVMVATGFLRWYAASHPEGPRYFLLIPLSEKCTKGKCGAWALYSGGSTQTHFRCVLPLVSPIYFILCSFQAPLPPLGFILPQGYPGCATTAHTYYSIITARKRSFTGVCLSTGAYMAGRRAWQGVCMAGGGMHGRGCAWQGGMHGRGACVAGGQSRMDCMHGRVVCVVGGMCGRGHAWQWMVCMAGCVHGRGCLWQRRSVHGTHTPLQILRNTVNERAVRILLECILVNILLLRYISNRWLNYAHFHDLSGHKNGCMICPLYWNKCFWQNVLLCCFYFHEIKQLKVTLNHADTSLSFSFFSFSIKNYLFVHWRTIAFQTTGEMIWFIKFAKVESSVDYLCKYILVLKNKISFHWRI